MAMIRDDCIDKLSCPEIEDGHISDEGVFLRNLKKKHVSKRYEKDEDDNPVYGLKLNNRFWNDALGQDDLSVNSQPCIHSDKCSIAIHPTPDSYYHVAELDLSTLNEALPEQRFVASYCKQGDNCCHYELLPVDGSTSALLTLQTLLDAPFPSGKLPSTLEEKKLASEARDLYERILKIRKWIRGQDGTL